MTLGWAEGMAKWSSYGKINLGKGRGLIKLY